VHQIANPLNLLDVFGGRRDYQFNKINGLGVKSDRLLVAYRKAGGEWSGLRSAPRARPLRAGADRRGVFKMRDVPRHKSMDVL
jgi:hypothetical protein